MSQTKIYPLLKSWWTLFISGILLALFAIILFFIYQSGLITITGAMYLFGFILGLALLTIFYVLTNRLMTTQHGIKIYFFYKFHFFVPWNNLSDIQMGPFGNVFLVSQTQLSQYSILNVFFQTIQLDSYIDDWQNNDFVQVLRSHAPQITIPNEILQKRKVDFLYRTSTFIFYFVACMALFVIPPLLVPEGIIQPIKFSWDLAILGLFGGTLGGIAELLRYSAWLNTQPDKTSLKRVAKVLYVTPFSAWIMVFIFSAIFHILINYQIDKSTNGIINIISLLIGFMQFNILQRIYTWMNPTSNS